MKIFRKFINLDGIFICISLFFFEKDIFPPEMNKILLLVFIIFIFSFIVVDIIPSIFPFKKRKEKKDTELQPPQKWLLWLTENIESLIKISFKFSILVLGYFYLSDFTPIPNSIGYLYWVFFGAYFSTKFVRFSILYQKKYRHKEID